MKRTLNLLLLVTLLVLTFGAQGVNSVQASESNITIMAAPPVYYPSGPQTGVDESALTGWSVCWSSDYGTDWTNPDNLLTTVLANCDGDYLLLAGGPVASTVYDVLAVAPRADVIFDTGTGNTPHNANGSGWYYNDDYSWGFALAGDPIDRGSCDWLDSNDYPGTGPNGDLRLCWHTANGSINTGWRSGKNSSLGSTYRRVIYQPATYYPSGPQASVDESLLTGWTLCWSSTYASTYSDPANNLTTVLSACDGNYLLLAGRPVGSTVFDVVAAAPRADVIFDTGTGNTPHDANGVGWYYNNSYSWGFAKAGDPISRGSCDTGGIYNGYPNSDLRLCWHTYSNGIDSGWRSGANANLNGNASFERFIYETNAVPGGDTTDPVLNLPANMTVPQSIPAGAVVNFSATATDETAPANPVVTCVPPSGSTFPLGTTTVNCEATDDAGNTANGSFDVTVTAAVGGNLLKKPDFANAAVFPSPWRAFGFKPPYAAALDCTIFNNGPCSVVFGPGNRAAYQQVNRTGVAGDVYSFGMYSASQNAPIGGNYRIELSFFNNLNKPMGKVSLYFNPLTHGFELASGNAAPTGNYNKIIFKFIYNNTSGRAWFDDAFLYFLGGP